MFFAAVVAALSLTAAAPPARIVAVGGGVTESVFALGLGDRVVAVDGSSVFPAAVTTLPQVGYHRALSAEGVISQRPDVVVLTDEAGPPAAIAQLKAAGVNVVVIPEQHSIAG
ncbi:MAG TPA: ABC transporter substrate-binding protein, partial [Myxococcota bacterium]